MIKGHAVIELKDVKTGEVQRVEHDNMITNGLKYCLTPWLGKFSYATGGNTPQVMLGEATETRKNRNRSIMDHLLGGIFLFQNNLEEDIDNTTFPTDNPLVGKASWDAYSGSDTYRGSYNENESGLQEDGSYKKVWDFSTNQANGQISALALTTYKGGICGDGFKEWNDVETVISEAPFFNVGHIRINSNNAGTCLPFIRPSSNEIFYLKNQYNLRYSSSYPGIYLGNTKKIIFEKKIIPLVSLSPFYDYYNQYHIDEIEVEVPEEFVVYANNRTCRGIPSDEYLYIYVSGDTSNLIRIKTGQSFKLMRIRKTDLKTDVVTLTNNTPYEITMEEINFTDDHCFVQTYNAPFFIYSIRIADNEIVEFERGRRIKTRKLGDHLYTIEDNNKYDYCINAKTMEEKKHPLTGFNKDSSVFSATAEKIVQGIYLWCENHSYFYDYGYTYAYVYISPNNLMTINNLPSPVIKTAAQTMKVTYTIQETE